MTKSQEYDPHRYKRICHDMESQDRNRGFVILLKHEYDGGIDIMTKEEFLELDYGNIVTCKRYPGEI